MHLYLVSWDQQHGLEKLDCFSWGFGRIYEVCLEGCRYLNIVRMDDNLM